MYLRLTNRPEAKPDSIPTEIGESLPIPSAIPTAQVQNRFPPHLLLRRPNPLPRLPNRLRQPPNQTRPHPSRLHQNPSRRPARARRSSPCRPSTRLPSSAEKS